MARVKQRIYAGKTLDICIMNTTKGQIGSTAPKCRERFKTEEERTAFNNARALRDCIRLVNENFTPKGYYLTLTFDDKNEIYSFKDARKIREIFRRRIKNKCQNDIFMIFMGRGGSTARIHFHMIYEGENIDYILKSWTWGEIKHYKHLREHNKDPETGKDTGQDYTALTTYLWNHWTPEQGGKHFSACRNMRKPTRERTKESKRRYSPEKPPKAPKGYSFIKCTVNTSFGFQCFHFVKLDEQPGSGNRHKFNKRI